MKMLTRAAFWLLAPILLAFAAMAPAANVVAPMGDIPAQVMCFGAVGGTATCGSSGGLVSVTPTIQNAAYASTNCMGGFQTVALGSSVSVLNQIGIFSKGGLATAKLLYVFSANPSASTCTDKSTFTLNAADVSKVMLIVSLTPATTTGTSVTSAFASNIGLGVPSGGTVYLAIVDTATETPGTTSDLVVNLGAF